MSRHLCGLIFSIQTFLQRALLIENLEMNGFVYDIMSNKNGNQNRTENRMKLKTRIIVGFVMIILVPLLLFAATLYGFGYSQANRASGREEAALSEGTYELSIAEVSDGVMQIRVMTKDLFLTASIILVCTALSVGLWIYRSIAAPLLKLKKATRNIKEGTLSSM